MKNEISDLQNQDKLIAAFDRIDTFITNKYLSNLTDYDVIPLDRSIASEDISKFSRFFKVDKLVFEKNENNQNKLATVYQALHILNSPIITIIESDKKNINFYIGVRDLNGDVATCADTLNKSFDGNFFGSKITNLKGSKIKEIFENIDAFEGIKTISTCSVVSSIKQNKNKDSKNADTFVQGIEKIIEAMKGEKYSMVIISEPVSNDELSVIRSGYEEVYSSLTPFSKSQLSLNKNESTSVTNTIGDNFSQASTVSISKTLGSTSTTGTNDSIGKTKGFSILGVYNSSKTSTTGSSRSKATNESSSDSNSEATTRGTNSSRGDTFLEGISTNLQISTINKTVSNILEKIDLNLKRLDECADVGVWKSATYFITEDTQTNNAISSNYQSIMRGKNSSLITGAINTWTADDDKTKDKLKYISEYISKIHHPIFKINNQTVSPSVLVSSSEMSIQSGLPQKSVPGLPVITYATFAREIIKSSEDSDAKKISIGNVFHLGEEEENKVCLDTDSLCSHTFITGSTGSGKSNTMYNIINNLIDMDKKFLVIEPAKGEYKNIFGHKEDVSVYGSNLKYSPLLKINPFSFCDKVHVLEHIDRLMEIFNVCWSLYHSMPAILKKAIENAYIASGWNLNTSENMYENIFPSFIDVLTQLRVVIASSDYSEQLKGDLMGALCTRIESLTNGIYGQIFSSNELTNRELFDENVIVDISRIGSVDTKSMIMGILILKLSEYRMSEDSMNSQLKHVTILEEAHNILKRTSTEQNSESPNLIGKSVEMISNSIAEMRTHGEGFIIVDQSPSAVDMSAIRNTNTKIIMRLPEFTDREMVGKSANLNDEQIKELAKLETGVSAVYQNNWIEAVLCKINKSNIDETTKYNYDYKKGQDYTTYFIKYLLDICLDKSVEQYSSDILNNIYKLETRVENKINIILFDGNINKQSASYILFDLLNFYNILSNATSLVMEGNIMPIDILDNFVIGNINSICYNLEDEYKQSVIDILIDCGCQLGHISDDIIGDWKEYRKSK